jgi:hypothetical protein
MWFKKTFGRQDHIKTNTGLCKGEIIKINICKIDKHVSVAVRVEVLGR